MQLRELVSHTAEWSVMEVAAGECEFHCAPRRIALLRGAGGDWCGGWGLRPWPRRGSC